MKIVSHPRHVIWAVDLFSRDQSLQRSTAKILKAMLAASSVVIEPVYVTSGFPPDMSEGAFDRMSANLQKDAEIALRKLLGGMKLAGMAPVKILSDGYFSLRNGTDLLTDYAHKSNAQLIALSTHGRSGIKRAFLGSFAETLVFNSDLPLLLVNPHWKTPARIKHILFPTDFSDPSETAFDSAVEFAKREKGKITLFYKVPHFFPLPEYSPLPYLYDGAGILQDEVNEAKDREEHFSSKAKKFKVSLKPVVDTRIYGSIAEGILDQSKKSNCGLIAMAAHSGPARFALLGSVAREVIRRSAVPVWLIRSPATENKQKMSQKILKKSA